MSRIASSSRSTRGPPRRPRRNDTPFTIHAISLDAYSPDGIKRMEEAGITDAIVGFRDAYQRGPDTETLDQKLTALRWFAESVISKV